MNESINGCKGCLVWFDQTWQNLTRWYMICLYEDGNIFGIPMHWLLSIVWIIFLVIYDVDRDNFSFYRFNEVMNENWNSWNLNCRQMNCIDVCIPTILSIVCFSLFRPQHVIISPLFTLNKLNFVCIVPLTAVVTKEDQFFNLSTSFSSVSSILSQFLIQF